MGGYCERFSETAGVGKGTSTDAGDLSRHNCFSLRGDLRLDVSDAPCRERSSAGISTKRSESAERASQARSVRLCLGKAPLGMYDNEPWITKAGYQCSAE